VKEKNRILEHSGVVVSREGYVHIALHEKDLPACIVPRLGFMLK